MLQNYFKIAFRSLWRSKVHATINILGLGLGIACCLLIVLFVRDEWTFDKFHQHANQIYRAYVKEDYGENEKFFNTVTPFPLGPVLDDNFEEIVHQVRINNIGPLVRVGTEQYTETVTIGGQDFFKVFDFEVTKGEKHNLLHSLNDLVITEATSKKYFGDDNPVGKMISMQLGETFEDFVVKAVVKDPPINSSIQFTLLISDLNYPKLYSEQALTSGWFNINPETYIMLSEGTDVNALQEKFPALFKSVLGDDRFKESNYLVGLQPLTDIHLNTDFPVGNAPVSNPRYSYILAAIALLILFVACINFVTLSVGRSLRRAREVGIRKAVGAVRQQLITQFIGEALLVTCISLSLGILLAIVCLPLFNDLSGKTLSLRPDSFMLTIGLTLVLIIGVFAGSYPALVLSGFRPIAVLKGKVSAGSSKQHVRQILVGVQLVLSIFLISSTMLMQRQLNFLQNKDLGFSKEQLAVVQLNTPRGRLAERVAAGFEQSRQFKNALAQVPDIAGVCASAHDFGNGAWTQIGYTDDQGTYRNFNLNIVDDDYIPVLRMQLAAGRNFNDDNPSDMRRSIIVNEAFVREMGWDDAIGKRIPGKGFSDHEIIGVIEDFNYASLYTRVEPLVIAMDAALPLSGTENIMINNSPVPKLLIRLMPGNMNNTIEEIHQVWDKITGGEEFTFTFADQAMAAQYRNDQNLGKIVSLASLLAIVIGSLGLYGLASLAMQNRVKEISIRKVLGATQNSLLILLSRDYVYLVLITLVISVPLTWWMMDNWLSGFEYRISIGWDVFLFAGALSLLIALLTISYQAIRTAWTQPADTLKYE